MISSLQSAGDLEVDFAVKTSFYLLVLRTTAVVSWTLQCWEEAWWIIIFLTCQHNGWLGFHHLDTSTCVPCHPHSGMVDWLGGAFRPLFSLASLVPQRKLQAVWPLPSLRPSALIQRPGLLHQLQGDNLEGASLFEKWGGLGPSDTVITFHRTTQIRLRPSLLSLRLEIFFV